MSEVLTPERVTEIGRETKRLLLQHLPADELLAPSYRQHVVEQIALNMHDQGFDASTIAIATGLSIARVRVLLSDEDDC